MKIINRDIGISNPFSTGGGGITFEHSVGVTYLVSLLAGDIPRGLDWGITKEVYFQHRWSGNLLDDICVIASNGYADRKLAIQVKHSLTFSNAPSNTEFRKVIKECWKTFRGEMGWTFDPQNDRLGIAFGVYSKTLDYDFRPLLDIARTSRNSSDFIKKISLPSFQSNKRREYLSMMKDLLGHAKGEEITDDELWLFLKCFVVMYFDLESAGNSDSLNARNRMLDLLSERNYSQGLSLFNELKSIVGENARSAGSIDLPSLRSKISSINLKDHPNYAPDLYNLRIHTSDNLERINDTIGKRIRIPRQEMVNKIIGLLEEFQVIVLLGEPMTGKSVLLKSVAERLRNEGEIFVFDVESFSGTDITSFLHNHNVQNDFNKLLFAAGTPPLRCVFIDGLEHAVNSNKRRVLNDLIRKVKQYNEQLISNNIHGGNSWKIIVTCRNQEYEQLYDDLEIARNHKERTAEIFNVEAFDEQEINEVVNEFPEFEWLTSQKHINSIIRKPFILDKITNLGFHIPLEQFPEKITESWLIKKFWEKSICSQGEGLDERANQQVVLKNVARMFLKGETPTKDNEDTHSVIGLISDDILQEKDNVLRFSHDTYREWILCILFQHHQHDFIDFLKEYDESPYLVRPFQLFSSWLLEVRNDPQSWITWLNELKNNKSISPRWHQFAFTAALISPISKQLLESFRSLLIENNGLLLAEMAKYMRYHCSQPTDRMKKIASFLKEKERIKLYSLSQMPIWEQWIPIVQLLLEYIDSIDFDNFDIDMANSNSMILHEFSNIARKWMEYTEGDMLFRKETAERCLVILNAYISLSQKHNICYLYTNTEKSLLLAFFLAGDIMPDKVEAFTRDYLFNPLFKTSSVDTFLLDFGWIPLVKYLPQMAVDLFTIILCKEPENGMDFSYLDKLGIYYTTWFPPQYAISGPFFLFLSHNFEEGLQLIHNVVNHATKIWKNRENIDRANPVSQHIRLSSKNIEVWGNERIYYWYRFISTAPNAVNCALIALEEWMNTKIKDGVNPEDLFENVLKDTKSVSIVGVCASVALANFEKCKEAIVPILENSAFWRMDIDRRLKDSYATSQIEMASQLTLSGDRSEFNYVLKLAKQEHRNRDIREFVMHILFMDFPEILGERILTAIKNFTENLPFLYEEEKANTGFIEQWKKTTEIWSATTDPKNYRRIKISGELEEEVYGIVFQHPKEIQEKIQPDMERLYLLEMTMRFFNWSRTLMENSKTSNYFTLESAKTFVDRVLSKEIDEEISPFIAMALSAYFGGMVVWQWQWVEENNLAQWFRNHLLAYAQYLIDNEERIDEYNRTSMSVEQSTAYALPTLYKRFPDDHEIIDVLIKLATHKNHSIRAQVFSELRNFWKDHKEIVLTCAHNIIQKAIEIGVKRLRKKSTHQGNGNKPVREYLPDEISIKHLESVLFCFPKDNRIIELLGNNELLQLMEEILHFTINTYSYNQKENRSYNYYLSSYDWHSNLFSSIGNALLKLPQEETRQMLLDPILNNWKKTPSIMEVFLQSFVYAITEQGVEDRAVELWHVISDAILSSELCKPIVGHLKSRMGEILAYLIFTHPLRELTWNVEEWTPLQKMVDIIERWVETVGRIPECFPQLVKFLNSIGSVFLPEPGIHWLFYCVKDQKNYDLFFQRKAIKKYFAKLLYNIWSKYSDKIKDNSESFKCISMMVDILSSQGVSLAIQLQNKIIEI